MIRLKNVSKFYYSKGIIASGFSKVNLELKLGEFVVITGESGSGKSTLLNVISGLDTYEEGEMYIDGVETSHYTSDDFEQYRKKYIGNIFQNFNLVNSYTVYQNVELILLINGYSKEEISQKVPEIIEKVGLTEYTKTKVSKLSGGQKQRVSIARALAKDTSIIVADEPTGNLDSVSAEGIVSLLKDLAKDRLIIVVTHNFDQFAAQATRVIKMHDGKIVEDKIVSEVQTAGEMEESICNTISKKSKLKLGFRNTFNILPKFLLLLVVFLFVILAVSGEYTSFAKSKEESGKLGYNGYFANSSTKRIVLKKDDKSLFTDEDYKKISELKNVGEIVKEDVSLDKEIQLEKDDFSFRGYPKSIESMEGNVDKGEKATRPTDVVIAGHKDDYGIQEGGNLVLGQECKLTFGKGITVTVKVVGIKYIEERHMGGYGQIYLSPEKLKDIRTAAYQEQSEIRITMNGSVTKSEEVNAVNRLAISDNVKPGEALVSSDLNIKFPKEKAVGNDINVEAKNLYFSEDFDVRITDTYDKNTYQKKTGIRNFDENNGEIYVNREDYARLFDKGDYQSSIYVKEEKDINKTKDELIGMGYKPLLVKDTLADYGAVELIGIVQVPMAVVLILILFFISYFVIRLILKSRSGYFTILRMLGMSRVNSKRILDIEFLVIINIAYLLFLAVVGAVATGVVKVPFISSLIRYLSFSDYIILYVFVVIMAYLIASKFARAVFKKSAMNTFREEA